MLNRRQMIRGIGAAIIAGSTPVFVPGLLPSGYREMWGSLPFEPVPVREVWFNLDSQIYGQSIVKCIYDQDGTVLDTRVVGPEEYLVGGFL